MNRKVANRKNQAFALIELLVVIASISILVGLTPRQIGVAFQKHPVHPVYRC